MIIQFLWYICYKVNSIFLRAIKNIPILTLIYLCTTGLLGYAETNSTLTQNLKFTENKKQWAPHILFQTDFNGGRLFLEQNTFTYVFYENGIFEKIHPHDKKNNESIKKEIKLHSLKIHLLNSNTNTVIAGKNETPDYRNYFIGNDESKWASNVKSYKEVVYSNVYDNIDLKIYSSASNTKTDYIVKQNGDVNSIQLSYKGQYKLSLKNNHLYIKTSVGNIIEQKPYAYQIINGIETEVPCYFSLNNNVLSFKLPNGYNKNLPLIIDPTLIFSTFSGSTDDNWGMTATYDAAGNAYAGGIAWGIGYPTTVGAYQTFFAGGGAGGGNGGVFLVDAVITKYNSTGTTLIYSTFLGGSDNEQPQSLVVDNNNNLNVFGRTYSNNFPTTFTAYDRIFNGGADIFVTKFNTNGTALVGSTYIGGTGDDGVNFSSIEVVLGSIKYNYSDDARGEIIYDNNNDVYVASCTQSTNFPTTAGAFRTFFQGGLQDGCVFKLNSNLTSLQWSTYLGGNQNDAAYSISLDNTNSPYVTGGTESTNFPTKIGAYKTAYQGGIADGFISHLNSTGTTLLHGTFLGTNLYDQSFFVQTDKTNNVYVFGQSRGAYPVSVGVYSNANSGQFVHKLNPTLTTSIFSTVFGSGRGTPDISPSAFLVDTCENIYISGWGGTLGGYNQASSSTLGMPTTGNAYQLTTDGSDMYVMSLGRDALTLMYGTYFGGSISLEHVDGGTSRFDKYGNIYQSICGGCGGQSDMPTTPGAWSQTNNSNNCNNALFKMHFDLINTTASFTANPFPLIGCTPFLVTFTNTTLNGQTYLWDFGDGSTSANTNPTHTYVTPGTYNIVLYAYNNQTCNLSDTAYGSVTVVAPPTIIPMPDTFVCFGNSVQLNATGGGLTYTWTPATYLNNPNISNPIAAPDTTTQYIVEVSNAYCSSYDTVIVNVVQAYITQSGPTTFCAGDSVILDAGAGHLTYSWSNGQNTQVIIVKTSGNYIVTTTDVNGCISKDTMLVIVQPAVIANAGNDTLICIGNSAILNATGGTSYLWTPATGLSNVNIANPTATINTNTQYVVLVTTGICSDYDTVNVFVDTNITSITPLGPIPFCIGSSVTLDAGLGYTNYLWSTGQNTQTITVNTTGNYWVSTLNPNGCVGQDTIAVTVLPPVLANAGNDTMICLGDSIQLLASGGISYTWTPATGLSNTNTANPYAKPLVTTTYIVDVFNGGCSAKDTITITVQDNITQITPLGPTMFCIGGSVVLDAGAGHSTYLWSTGQITQTITVTQSGNYSVQTLNANGCDATDTISILALPILDAYNDTGICEGESAQIFATGGISFTWIPVIGLDNPSSSSPTATPSQTTTYYLVSNETCNPTDSVTITIFPLPQVDAGADQYIDFGDRAYLNASGNSVYRWSPDKWLNCTVCPSPVSIPDSTITYYVTVTSAEGCTAVDSVTVFVKQVPAIFVPNAFTPNGNGTNEFFAPKFTNMKEVEVKIFDRWGEMIASWNDLNGHWDGTYKGRIVQQDVYVWVIDATDIYDKKTKRTGTVTVVK